ncbi:MAG TPA: hypothetical protein G4O03_08245 [Dehalococcoidia bacterium]|nr:hypothetical protein [Dehalococcoidia bacterium]
MFPKRFVGLALALILGLSLLPACAPQTVTVTETAAPVTVTVTETAAVETVTVTETAAPVTVTKTAAPVTVTKTVAPSPTPVGPPITFKVSHQWAEGDVRDRLARAFGDLVTERTGGSITFEYYPARALYKPKEQWDAMRTGALDMSVFPLDYASGKVPQFSITLMPCIVPTMEVGLSWKDKQIGYSIDGLCLANGVRHVIWVWMEGGPASKKNQIILPEDVAGHKMRAAGKKFEYMLREAGAAITSMPSSEIYHALATGVLDSALTSSGSWVSYKLYEQVKYINVARDYAIWFMEEGLYMSQKSYDRMTPEQKRIFNACAAEIQDTWVLPNFKQAVQTLIEVFGKAGVEMHFMTKSEWEVWLKFAQETAWKSFAETVEGGQELLDQALAALE